MSESAKGYIYLIAAMIFAGFYKIGKSKSPQTRIKGFTRASFFCIFASFC